MTPEELQQTAGLPVTESPLSALARKYLTKIGSGVSSTVDRAAAAMPDPYNLPGPVDAARAVVPAPQQAAPVQPMIGPPEDPAAPKPPPTPPVYGQAPAVIPMRNAGAVVRPAGWQPGAHAVAMNRGMAPDELARGQELRDVAAGHRLMGADSRLEAAQMQGMVDGVYSSARMQAEQRAAEQMQALNARREQYVAQEQKKLQALAAKAQAEIDPNQLWKEKGTAAQAGAAIMMAIGEFASQWRKTGRNGAMQVVNQAIDRNIDAQKSNLSAARNAFDMRQNLYQQNLAAFGDQERAALATKIQYLNGVEAMAGQYLAQAKTKEAEAAHSDLLAQISDERARVADDFATRTHTHISEQMTEAYRPSQVIGGGAQIGEKGKEGLYVPSLSGYARSTEEARALHDHDARTRTINQTLERARDIITEANTLRPTSVKNLKRLRELQGELDSLSNAAAVKQTVKEGQGAMSKGDKEVSDATLGVLGTKVWDPKMYVIPGGSAIQKTDNEKALAVIKATQERALMEHRINGESLGVMPGREVYVETPHGYEPRRVYTPGRMPLTTPSTTISDVVKKPVGRTK
jgi:hypothetical protein